MTSLHRTIFTAAAGITLLAGTTAGCSSSGASHSTGPSEPTSSSSSGSTSSSSTAANAAACARLAQTGTRVARLSTLIRNPAGAKKVVAEDLAAFRHVRPTVPAQVRPAVSDLITVLSKAETAIAHPTRQNVAAVQAAGATLPHDTAQLASYLKSNCPR